VTLRGQRNLSTAFVVLAVLGAAGSALQAYDLQLSEVLTRKEHVWVSVGAFFVNTLMASLGIASKMVKR
jgi:tetrahydromethanopterin S-methyltransferase subunit D